MRACPGRWVVVLGMLTAVLLTVWLAGCGGSSGGAAGVDLNVHAQPDAPVIPDDVLESEADQMEPPQELPPDLVIVGDSLPAFPGGDAEGPLSAWRATSEEGQRLVEGNERVAEAGSGNYPAEESDGYVIVPGGDDELSAWIQFSVPEFDNERPTSIYFAIDAAPLIPGGDEDLPLSYWVGVGNFTHYCWDWYGPYDDDEGFELNSAELKDRFVSEDGVQHFVVLTLAGEEFAGEGNPEGLTAAEVEFTRIDTLTVDDAEYFHTNPHYVWIDALELRDGYKGASALDPDTQYVTIEWAHHRDFVDANSEASLYQVQRELVNDPLADPVLLNTVGAPGLMFVDPTDANPVLDKVVPGRTYQYYIRAQNPLDGFTPWSLARTVTIPLLAPPDLAASDGNPADQLVLTWTKSEGATGYRIFRDGQEPEDLIVTVGDVDTYTDTDIKDIEVHTYWIRARNDYALSDFSEPDTGFLLLTLPVAMLSGDPLDGEFPLEVHFDASASHDPDNGEEPGMGIVSYEFDFGEGSGWEAPTSEAEAVNVYEVRQAYTIRVRVTDNDGQTDICDEPVEISPNDPPVAELEATPLKGEPPLEVTFDASGSHDDDGAIVRYDWDFDNDDVIDDTTTEPTNSHFYESKGKYSARVDVVDDDDEAGVAYSGEIKVNLHPSAVLAADPVAGTAPLTVQFDASGSTDADGDITKYEFDFGEGDDWEDRGLNDSPEHKYDEPGEYSVKLRVTDDYDDADTDETVTISVGDATICYAAWDGDAWEFTIFVVTAEGDCRTAVGTLVDGWVAPAGLAWSPDRSRIAFAYGGNLGVINADGTDRELIYTGATYCAFPYWEDNEYILFSVTADGDTDIVRIRYDGVGGASNVSTSGDSQDFLHGWLSPDGKSIVASVGAGPSNWQIGTANYPSLLNWSEIGGKAGDSDIMPCWSPDGSLVAWRNDAEADIYTVDAEGEEVPTAVTSSRYNSMPCFSPDSSQILYMSNTETGLDGSNLRLMDADGSNDDWFTSEHTASSPDWWHPRRPVADLVGSPTDGSFPLTVDFDASDSYDMDNGSSPGGGIELYEWDFDGDGVFNEAGDEWDAYDDPEPSPTYDTWGIYRAVVRVTDDEGDTNTASIFINSNPSWHSHVVVSSGTTGRFTSIADLGGKPAIAFQGSSGYLSYARATSASPGSSTDWVAYAINGHLTESISLSVLGGKPIISSYWEGDDDLEYAQASVAVPDSEDWSQHGVELTGRPGNVSTSLVVLDGKPAIAYYERDGADLKFAWADSGAPSSSSDWDIHVVDDGGTDDVGRYCSMVILDGKPMISYYDLTNLRLLFIRSTVTDPDSSGDWSSPHVVDTGGNVGEYSSLALIDGKPAIAYRDTNNVHLKYARATTAAPAGSGDWEKHTVIPSGQTGAFCSLVSLNGVPAISFKDTQNGYQQFAVAAQAAPGSSEDWFVFTVDSSANVGSYGSLAIVDGAPHFSYFDDTSDDLKFARPQ